MPFWSIDYLAYSFLKVPISFALLITRMHITCLDLDQNSSQPPLKGSPECALFFLKAYISE